MHFLVIDDRYGTPIYVFLELDPRGMTAYPGLTVREVTLETPEPAAALGRRSAIGRDPQQLDHFRGFGSDGAVAGAGYILIEPRYVGPSWEAYSHVFRPHGEKPVKCSR